MKPVILILVACGIIATGQQTGPAPIYRVTVTERTVKAINYQYRNGPTLIDFRGTVLMPKAKGEASVESKQGRTEVDVRFENVTEPQKYGREYLTYVLWALTPDGRPHNMGEVITGSSDKSHLHVTTDYQAFALIVTAEPYSAVRQPSDVVVMENVVRPDTVGKIEQVEARYELLPRGEYSWQVPDNMTAPAQGPKVSMRKYEELLEIYQAQNAVGVARAAHAQQYAPNTLAKAEQLLTNAQQMEQSKAESRRIVEAARESAQTAEDARIISERKLAEEKLANANSEVTAAQQAQAQSIAEVEHARREVDKARSEAENAKAVADAERVARERAEADAANARATQAQVQAQAQAQLQAQAQVQAQLQARSQQVSGSQEEARRKGELRMQLLEMLNGPLSTRDTPRGLVATVTLAGFSGAGLQPSASEQIGKIGMIIAAHPGLRVEVEGNSDTAGSEALCSRRAESVREALIRRGVSPSSVTARGLGNTHPLASNASASGREENQRVEIVISGDPIGEMPFWDRTYPLTRK